MTLRIHVHDDAAPRRAAGFAIEAPGRRYLFLRRSGAGDHPGEWCFPGGEAHDGESAEDAARRETFEETGARLLGDAQPITVSRSNGVHYTTFHHAARQSFTPRLNHEHTAHVWATATRPPEPLHPGVRGVLNHLRVLGAPRVKIHVHDHAAHKRWTIDDFEEAQHPRATSGAHAGEFAKKGGGGSSAPTWSRVGGGAFSPTELNRLKTLRVPPAWTHIELSNDPNAALQVKGRDAKGRTQYLYSAEHSQKAAAEKFARLKAFNDKAPTVAAAARRDMNDESLSPKMRDSAAIVALIAATGFRPGSEADTAAEEKAHGASNLRVEHVKVAGDELRFEFIGKKGVAITKTLRDAELARYIAERQKRANSGEQLFAANDVEARNYMQKHGGEGFKLKDFRTWNGTCTALKVVAEMPVPKSEAAFKKARMQVGKIVAEHLGNTPTVALESYIDPTVFAAWGK